MTLKEILTDYRTQRKIFDHVNYRYIEIQKFLEETLKKTHALREALPRPSWEQVVWQIATEIQLNNIGYKVTVTGPFGLCNDMTIDIEGDGHRYLVLRPLNIEEGIFVIVDPTSNSKEYSDGTVGAKSGMNYRTYPLPSTIEELETSPFWIPE